MRPFAVAACDLDVTLAPGRVPLPGPLPLGHEFVAEVLAASVRTVFVGPRVGVPFQIACGTCARCLTGNCTTVPARARYGLGILGGLDGDGTPVLVVGGGSIGLHAAGTAAALGGDVTYVDTDAERLGTADAAQLRAEVRSTLHGGECVDNRHLLRGGRPAPPARHARNRRHLPHG